MKVITPVLLACTLFLFSQCDNNSDPEFTSEATTLKKVEVSALDSITYLVLQPVNSDVTATVKLNEKRKDRSEFDKELKLKIDDEIARQLALNPDLPSLNSADDAYSKTTVSMFSELSRKTGGETYIIENASFVVEAITNIINTFLENNNDLVFVIDKTGSMNNDIEAIKKSISAIIKEVSANNNTRIGFVFYGDKNVEPFNWFEKYELSGDINTATNILKKIKTSGGGDESESVNDALAKTIKEMNWQSGRRRMVLLLGDAPSLLPPYSDYSQEEILQMSKIENVTMNIYPVVIGLKGSLKGIIKTKNLPDAVYIDLISSISPNPATNYALIKTENISDYTTEIFDINGKLIFTKNFHDNNVSILTNEYPTGVYIARIIDNTNHKVDTKKFVVRR